MNILNDQKGQGAAEYILLFGALQIYSSYFSNGEAFSVREDSESIRANLTNQT